MLRERLHRQLPVHLRDIPERRSAELHAALDHARAVVTHDPLGRIIRECLRTVRGRVLQCDFIESLANLGVGGVRDTVERSEVRDVCGWKGIVGLEAFEEDN